MPAFCCFANGFYIGPYVLILLQFSAYFPIDEPVRFFPEFLQFEVPPCGTLQIFLVLHKGQLVLYAAMGTERMFSAHDFISASFRGISGGALNRFVRVVVKVLQLVNLEFLYISIGCAQRLVNSKLMLRWSVRETSSETCQFTFFVALLLNRE